MMSTADDDLRCVLQELLLQELSCVYYANLYIVYIYIYILIIIIIIIILSRDTALAITAASVCNTTPHYGSAHKKAAMAMTAPAAAAACA